MKNTDKGFYLITFPSVSYAISAEKKLRDKANIKIIPTPREISATCGMALRIDGLTYQDVNDMFDKLEDGESLYEFGAKVNGKRDCKILKAKQTAKGTENFNA